LPDQEPQKSLMSAGCPPGGGPTPDLVIQLGKTAVTKDKALLVQCESSENCELCIGFSFRLRSSSYDGTRQPNILNRPLTQTISIRIAKAGFAVYLPY
jgi:hypothetical protein